MAETGGRKRNKRVVSELNARLSDELHAIMVYMIQAHLLEGWGFKVLGSSFKKQSIDEMKHAEELIERLVFFGVTPSISIPEMKFGEDVKSILELARLLEREAIDKYNSSAKVADGAGDQVSRGLFERNAKDEEDHFDWTQAQFDQIKQVGLERYLSERGDQGETKTEKSFRTRWE